jgi:hypothetical protein
VTTGVDARTERSRIRMRSRASLCVRPIDRSTLSMRSHRVRQVGDDEEATILTSLFEKLRRWLQALRNPRS